VSPTENGKGGLKGKDEVRPNALIEKPGNPRTLHLYLLILWHGTEHLLE
jgi:hypothetical protein